MAPTTRRTTGKAAPRKTGAASAVSKDKDLTVESDAPVTVSTPSSPLERAEAAADAEDARQAARAEAEAKAQQGTQPKPAPRGETVHQDAPATVSTEDPAGPPITGEADATPSVPGEVPLDHVVNAETAHNAASKLEDPADQEKVSKDIHALRALADTSGDPVTPYGGKGPAPLPPLPPLREVHNWTREGDTPATARVVVDGFRPRVNGAYRFARRGDRITAPSDIVDTGVKRGVLRREEV